MRKAGMALIVIFPCFGYVQFLLFEGATKSVVPAEGKSFWEVGRDVRGKPGEKMREVEEGHLETGAGGESRGICPGVERFRGHFFAVLLPP
jgi:hypothetical protein